MWRSVTLSQSFGPMGRTSSIISKRLSISAMVNQWPRDIFGKIEIERYNKHRWRGTDKKIFFCVSVICYLCRWSTGASRRPRNVKFTHNLCKFTHFFPAKTQNMCNCANAICEKVFWVCSIIRTTNLTNHEMIKLYKTWQDSTKSRKC
jgi:hypothetical protein